MTDAPSFEPGTHYGTFEIIAYDAIISREKHAPYYLCRCLVCQKDSLKRRDKLLKHSGCRHCQPLKHRAPFKYQEGDILNGLRLERAWFGSTPTSSHAEKQYDCVCLTCGDKSTKPETVLTKGHGCRLCRQKRGLQSEYAYEVGQQVGTLQLTRRWHGRTEACKSLTKRYDYHCQQCGYKHTMTEGNLKKGKRCPVCLKSPQVVVAEYNSIVASPETQWMIAYFPGGELEAAQYTPQSSKRLTLQCPFCGRFIPNYSINSLYSNQSIGCWCKDGVSYPERYLSALLNHLSIPFDFHPSFEWAPDFIYDFAIQPHTLTTPLLIETHGSQHYGPGFESLGGKTFEEQQAIDEEKRTLATRHYSGHYRELDCRQSDSNYLKSQLLASDFFDLLGSTPSAVNWIQVHQDAQVNLVYEVSHYWASHPEMTTTDLVQEFGLASTTIVSYLKRGTEAGWCQYDGKLEQRKNGRRSTTYTPEILALRKQVCDAWNVESDQGVSFIARKLGLQPQRVRKFLHYGTSLGWCHYDSETEQTKAKQRLRGEASSNRKETVCFAPSGDIVSVQPTVLALATWLKAEGPDLARAHHTTVASFCRQGRPNRHGYRFAYVTTLDKADQVRVQDWVRQQNDSSHNSF